MSTEKKAKAFMFVCFGVAALVVAFQMGINPARGQVGDQVVATLAPGTGYFTLVTAAGDVYTCWPEHDPWESFYRGNVFETVGPIPTESGSWGNLKGQYGGDD